MSAAPASTPPWLAAALGELGVDPAGVAPLAAERGASVHAPLSAADAAPARAAAERALRRMARDGALVLDLPGRVDDARLAALRDALWPDLHANAVVHVAEGRAACRTLSGKRSAPADAPEPRTLLVLQRREWVQSPEATVDKFDKNAAGWNGEPGRPGYGHFRWMRRFVGRYARPRPGDRVLDFGCGAGWCGIECVQGIPDTALAAFDPSPEMVRIAAENAAASGVTRFDARTGFGDEPPFPGPGEEPFDLVVSSGVVSFAPDLERFLDGLARSVRPGGTLVVGDINAGSRGMRRRRARKPLLPVRELNARTAADVRARLERRGFRHRSTTGYQLTYPVPELMHVSEARLGGLLSAPLLLANRGMAALDRTLGDALGSQFDSWVMELVAPEAPSAR